MIVTSKCAAAHSAASDVAIHLRRAISHNRSCAGSLKVASILLFVMYHDSCFAGGDVGHHVRAAARASAREAARAEHIRIDLCLKRGARVLHMGIAWTGTCSPGSTSSNSGTVQTCQSWFRSYSGLKRSPFADMPHTQVLHCSTPLPVRASMRTWIASVHPCRCLLMTK